MKIIAKSIKALKQGGIKLLISRAVKFTYEKLYPVLPQRYGTYNNVEVPGHKLFGRFVPGERINKPQYEQGIVKSMEKTVQKEDEVVILGGGIGVTSVKAAQLAGDPSNVKVFEGSEKQIDKMRKTFKKNDIEGIEVENAVVGPEINVWGATESSRQVKPDELPKCDVLEMDIEGSEIEVLKNLKIKPRNIIVESHGMNDAPTDEVKSILQDLSYDILDVALAEEKAHIERKDIKVITAARK